MISRRSFIAGIFAAASAPAIVKANNLMKLNSGILVPTNNAILDPVIVYSTGFPISCLSGDYDGNSIFALQQYAKIIPGRWQSINVSATQSEFVRLANLAEMHQIETRMNNMLRRIT